MKILSESIPTSHAQEVLGAKQQSSMPLSVATDTYTTLTSVVTEPYDKQELNNIFEMLQTSSFPDPSNEVSTVKMSIFVSLWASPIFHFLISFSFLGVRLFPTAIPSLIITPALTTPAPTPPRQQRGSGVSSSSPWELPQLPHTSPASCPWSTWTRDNSTPSPSREWTAVLASLPPK